MRSAMAVVPIRRNPPPLADRPYMQRSTRRSQERGRHEVLRHWRPQAETGAVLQCTVLNITPVIIPSAMPLHPVRIHEMLRLHVIAKVSKVR